MEPDELQQAWQAQASQTRVTVNEDLLRKEVQRNQRAFQAVIFGRDVREVGVGVVMLPLWLFLGKRFVLPWTWYLVVPAMVWVIGFMLVFRMRHGPRPSQPNEPLVQCVTRSLAEVNAQIWLLRRVISWYLLPFAIPILAFFGQVAFSSDAGFWLNLTVFSLATLFVFVVYGAIYYLNQYAVRHELEPRRQELLTLLTSLGDEASEVTNDGRSSEPSTVTHLADRPRSGTRRQCLGIAGISLVMVALSYLAYFFTEPRDGAGYPKQSPFTAVRWRLTQPEVQVNGEWFQFVSLDGIAAEEIVAFSQRTYGDLWQKRFEEDLVELLSRMGHRPSDKVTLVVQSLTTSEKRMLADVPLTEANRRAIYKAAQERTN